MKRKKPSYVRGLSFLEWRRKDIELCGMIDNRCDEKMDANSYRVLLLVPVIEGDDECTIRSGETHDLSVVSF